MRILVLTPRFPYPVIGGDRLRIYQICKHLSGRHKLTLLTFCDSKAQMDFPLPEDGVFSSVHRIYLPKWRSILNVVLLFITGRPLQVLYYRSSIFKNFFEHLLVSSDAVLSHLLRVGDYAKNLDILSIVDMTDAISMNYERSRIHFDFFSLKSIIHAVEFRRILEYERACPTQHELLSFVSAADVEYLFGDNSPDNTLVAKNGVDASLYKYQFNLNSKPVVAFIGNMVSFQNQDAALWFINHVLPILRREGDFSFRIVGQIPESVKAKFLNYLDVEVTGLVPSVSDVIRDCFSGVCPVRIGAGIQNKVLEYMALGLPTVSTSIGVEGLKALDGEHLYVADSPEDFSLKLLHLWRNRVDAERIALNSRGLIVSEYSWEASLAPLVSRINKLANDLPLQNP